MKATASGDSGRMNRREAIMSIAGSGSIGSGAIWRAGTLAAADQAVASDIVRFGADIEPLVRLIEETPRDKCIEVIASRLKAGLSYRELLSALFLAGIRNVSPQPPGFKFHCVFVLHSAHQLSLDAPASDRLLPLLWALDYFKQSQQRDADEDDFQLRNPKGRLPSADKAWAEFHAAMESWDEERGRSRHHGAGSHGGRARGHRGTLALWSEGLPQYRTQGDLHCQRLAHPASDRLASRGTGVAVACPRPDRFWCRPSHEWLHL